MSPRTLENRLAALENEVARLRSRVETEAGKPWWERIAGTFANDAVYARAMKLGQQYRRSLKSGRPAGKRR